MNTCDGYKMTRYQMSGIYLKITLGIAYLTFNVTYNSLTPPVSLTYAVIINPATKTMTGSLN